MTSKSIVVRFCIVGACPLVSSEGFPGLRALGISAAPGFLLTQELVGIFVEKRVISYALRLNFPATNNDAEYEALIAGLKIAIEFNLKTIQIFSDSQLIVRQVLGEYRATGPRLAPRVTPCS